MKFKSIFIFITLSSQFGWASVLPGIDVLKKNKFDALLGKRVGLITNQTGAARNGKSTIDILHDEPGLQLIKLFSPEHGIRGRAEHGQAISNDIDSKTRLPILSLYGKTKRPTAEMLKGLDVLVFDIQDIGTRFYTYTTTLVYAMEEAAKANLEFVVLDRPNPITGTIVEGEILDQEINHFTAYLHVPTRHGMTVGEIAKWFNGTAGIHARLTVIKMEGWHRPMWWEDTGLKFIHPSPNIKSVTAAALYPGIGCFEATNVSVGRGTGSPFEIIGAPWIEEKLLLEKLNFTLPPGFEFATTTFRPKADIYKGQKCRGIKIKIKDRNTARPVDLFVRIFKILKDLYPEEFVVRWDEMARVMGSEKFRARVERGESADSILVQIHDSAKNFEDSRKPYLLYKDDRNPDEFR